MIPVNRPFLPPLSEILPHLEATWERAWVTNQGPVARQLEQQLKTRVGRDALFVSNGTVAIHLALMAAGVCGTVLTTPFSFVATASAPLAAGFRLRFADIDPQSLNIDPNAVREAIDDDVCAILATHVYGNACDVDALAAIGRQAGIPVIYDAAHAFGATLRGKPLLSYGDLSTCSLHATKVVHSVEGGLVSARDPEVAARAARMRNFGINPQADGSPTDVGINAKNSEMHAAVGLTTLAHLDKILERRLRLAARYQQRLDGLVQWPRPHSEQTWNASYLAVLFRSEEERETVQRELAELGIGTRRYFSPALHTLPWAPASHAPVAESAARRVLALPMYYDLDETEVDHVANAIETSLSRFRRPAASVS